METPVRSYLKRSSDLLEKVVAENALLRRSNQEKDSLLNARRTRKKGKRVALKGKHVLSTAEVLELVEVAEKEAPKKKRGEGRKKQIPTPESSEEEEKTSEDDSQSGPSARRIRSSRDAVRRERMQVRSGSCRSPSSLVLSEVEGRSRDP